MVSWQSNTCGNDTGKLGSFSRFRAGRHENKTTGGRFFCKKQFTQASAGQAKSAGYNIWPAGN